MGTEFSWFYDLAAIAVVIAYIFVGAKRGFAKSMVLIVGFAAAGLISFGASNILSPAIYNALIRPSLVSSLEKGLENIDIAADIKEYADRLEGDDISSEQISGAASSEGDIFERLSELTGASAEDIEKRISDIVSGYVAGDIDRNVPTYVTTAINDFLSEGSESFSSMTRALLGSKSDAAAYIADSIAYSVVMPIIRIALFVIVFGILSFLVKRLAYTAGFVKRIPLAGSVDTLLGLLLGAAEGVVVLLVAVAVLRLIIMLTGDAVIAINTGTIEETRIFKEFYNLTFFDIFN